MKNLKCPVCGADLELSIGFTGCDWDCEAGRDSGFDHEISLNCTDDSCARVFPLGHVKKFNDFSPVIEKNRSFKY